MLNSIRLDIISAVEEFKTFTTGASYFSNKKYVDWRLKYGSTFAQITFPFRRSFISNQYKVYVSDFLKYMKNGLQIRIDYNNRFCHTELLECQNLFDSIEKYPLTEKQKEAIVHDEDNSLVIAGAGTGKTTTIVGKVVYLIDRLNISPSDILLLAFTRKAAEEMRIRLEKRLNKQLDAKTFHKFGLDIISQVTNVKPSVAFDSDDSKMSTIGKIFKTLTKDPHYLNVLMPYLLFYLKPYKSQDSFEGKESFDEYLKSNVIRSVRNERLKSYEEAVIANFLFAHNVNYVYEKPYEYATADAQHRQYKPDFYLPYYDVYIEHFAVDRQGNVPPWFDGDKKLTPKEKYNRSILWKREIHKKHGTRLVETYSYEQKEGILLQNLKKKLLDIGVELREKGHEEIYKEFEQQEDIPLIITLLTTFLDLFKSNAFSLEAVMAKVDSVETNGRFIAFMKIFEPIYSAYQNHLTDSNQIDFSDMIVKATGYIQGGKYRSPYRYILIDEFQDMSVGRYKLIKALIEQNPYQKLFCVGDDWQSIYRFTGSDLSVITDFESYFGYTKKTFLDHTFRFNNRIASFTSHFIQKNPRQLRKKLKTVQTTNEAAYKIVRKYQEETKRQLLYRLLEHIQKKAQQNQSEIFILARYNHHLPTKNDMFWLSKAFPNFRIQFLTAHSAKGLEADYVIIDSLTSGKYGFPTEIWDDPILGLVLAKPDSFDNAEERRLFYVACTRARHQIYLLTEELNPSKFVVELQREGCPKCGSAVSKRREKKTKRLFLVCSDHPSCTFAKQL